MGNNLIFGGVNIIAVGDLYQQSWGNSSLKTTAETMNH